MILVSVGVNNRPGVIHHILLNQQKLSKQIKITEGSINNIENPLNGFILITLTERGGFKLRYSLKVRI